MTRGLELWEAEAVVLRHALMSYRNAVAERNAHGEPYPMSDGFELVAADKLIGRLDIMSERLLTEDRRRANHPAEALDDEEPARVDVFRLGLNAEQTAILSSLLAHRRQTVSEWIGDVMFEYGLGRPNGKDYPPPSAATPPSPASAEEERHD